MFMRINSYPGKNIQIDLAFNRKKLPVFVTGSSSGYSARKCGLSGSHRQAVF
jgi:hypothetical protein